MKIKLADATSAKSPLMIVDDNIDNLNVLESMLNWGGFNNVHPYKSSMEALTSLERVAPDLIILDLSMPVMNGFEFLERVSDKLPPQTFLPILVYTADLCVESRIHALDLGASDFLTKPGDALEIQLRVRNLLRTRQLQGALQHHNHVLEAKVRQRSEHLSIARREAVDLLARACEFRDDETGLHTRRVGDLSASIAAELGLPADFVESIRLVAPLHDVGKIAIPDHILHKPSKLTNDEFAIMRTHVTIGASMLGSNTSPLLLLAADIARYHHERWDGRGYASGLAGEMIPLSARIVSVADAYDAMTNDRPYQRARSVEVAIQELVSCSGTQFDPDVVGALQRHLQRTVEPQRKAA